MDDSKQIDIERDRYKVIYTNKHTYAHTQSKTGAHDQIYTPHFTRHI